MADQRASRFFLQWSRAAQQVRREPAPAPTDWRGTLRSRLGVCAVCLAVWTVGIEARLLYLQVYQHTDMMARADRQQLHTLVTPAKRGDLVDRHGRALAYSVDADTIAADPTDITDPAGTARRVCAALDDCDAAQQQLMADRLRKTTQQFVYLARQISSEEANRVKALDLQGLLLTKESRRYYPNKELAAHLLGYVGTENVGLAGLEFAYDQRIRGREGKMLVQSDARRNAMLSREDRPPTAGDGLELTIDQNLQHIAERELRAGVEANNALGGTAIVMQPHTGEILALANWPTFNPNAFRRADAAARRNRAIQDVYEPGSTFKLVTASAALDERVVVPEDLIDCSPGYITFPGRKPIHDVHVYGVLPFTDVIVKSSNVGAIKVGIRVGPERMGRYISRFGFGQTLAPDFRGESGGMVWNPARLDPSSLASVSMGYQIAVTPLQMASAVSSIANGGLLVEPRVVRAFLGSGRREPVAPRTLRRTVSPETAATLTGIMEEVVTRGTAKAAQIGGYTIAGKTGTAAKLVNLRYSTSDYNASFVGFVPSRKPVLTIIVVIDSPHVNGHTGGAVSAPIFQRIAEASLRHLGVGPTIGAPSPVLVARHAPEHVDAAPVAVRTPAVTGAPAEHAAAGTMPDLRGLSAREALRTLTSLGMTARISGDGLVVRQTPAPGALLQTGAGSQLELARRPLAARESRPARPAPVTGGAPE